MRSAAQRANARAYAARGRLPLVTRVAARALDLVEDRELAEDGALAVSDRTRFAVVGDHLDVYAPATEVER